MIIHLIDSQLVRVKEKWFIILHPTHTFRVYFAKFKYIFFSYVCPEGNEKSLRSKNMNALLTRAKTFFADHYHGGSMKLCVIGRGSLC